MVKIPNKTRKSKIATPTASSSQRLSKNISTLKVTKKSEKPKTKGLSKPKISLTNKRADVELPCSSKQTVSTVVGIAKGNRIDTKNSWSNAWTQNEHNNNNKESSAQVTAPLNVTPQITSVLTVERTAIDEVEAHSMFRSGVRYSDVLRSKNVSSTGSVIPITHILPPTAPLIINANAPNEVTDIDLSYFPELGQHKNVQNANIGTTSVRLLQRTQSNNDEDSPQVTLERLETSAENNDTNETNDTNTENVENPNESKPTNSTCPLCELTSLWVQRALLNSAQPYHMDIPEFNFFRADQNYPRFLGQFEDENYLKTENLALLGLKLALGGNFHSMHTNNGR